MNYENVVPKTTFKYIGTYISIFSSHIGHCLADSSGCLEKSQTCGTII